jgi:anti-sigma factor RsiW
MSGQVVQLGTDLHQRVQALLPWYVGASLDEAERARVEAHIAECPRCQAELAWEREIQSACAHSEPAATGNADQGFALLRNRIAADAPPRQRRGVWARLKDRWLGTPGWTRWALGGQCFLVAALGGVLLVQLAPDQRYRALGGPAGASGATAGGNLIVRFRPEATEQEMRRVLRDSEARLVYGPTATDAYLLAVPAGLETAAVQRLRKESAVLLVESLDGRAAP